MRKNKLYKVTFLSHGRSIELHAHHVASSAPWGFTEIGDLVLDAPAEGGVIDPTEERLREEFKDTTVLHVPMHAIVRIEEVSRRGTLRVREADSSVKIMPFPGAPLREG